MNKAVVWLTTIFVLVFGIAFSFGQQVSPEARKYFDRGNAAMEMAKTPQDCEAAIREFEQAVRLAPNWPDAYYNLGLAQEKAEKLADAIRSYGEYLRLAPNAKDFEEVTSLINKLEYKKENMLSASEVIDVLISYANDAKLPHANRVWKESLRPPATDWLCGFGWDLTRAGDDSVRLRTRSVFPYVVDGNIKAQTGEPTHYYETARVEGRILRFRFTFVNWDTPTELEIEVEVVSKTLIRVTETVTTPGKWHKEWREGQSVSGELKQDINAAGSPEITEENKPAALARSPAGGSDVDAKDFSGWTALMRACRSGDQKEVERLIAKGADINAKEDNHDTTPLRMAVSSGSKEIVELLIAKGADMNAKADDDTRLLHAAAEIGSKEIIELLIAKGADINAKDASGNTPLHKAVVGFEREAAEFLIAKGADVNAKTKTGYTPLLLAAVVDRKDIVELLITKGADINSPNKDGLTPLRAAINNGNNDIAEVLRKHGAR